MNSEHTGLQCKQFYRLLHIIILLISSLQKLMNRTFTENAFLLCRKMRWIENVKLHNTVLHAGAAPLS